MEGYQSSRNRWEAENGGLTCYSQDHLAAERLREASQLMIPEPRPEDEPEWPAH